MKSHSQYPRSFYVSFVSLMAGYAFVFAYPSFIVKIFGAGASLIVFFGALWATYLRYWPDPGSYFARIQATSRPASERSILGFVVWLFRESPHHSTIPRAAAALLMVLICLICVYVNHVYSI